MPVAKIKFTLPIYYHHNPLVEVIVDVDEVDNDNDDANLLPPQPADRGKKLELETPHLTLQSLFISR